MCRYPRSSRPHEGARNRRERPPYAGLNHVRRTVGWPAHDGGDHGEWNLLEVLVNANLRDHQTPHSLTPWIPFSYCSGEVARFAEHALRHRSVIGSLSSGSSSRLMPAFQMPRARP